MYVWVEGLEGSIAVLDKYGRMKTFDDFLSQLVIETADLMRVLAPRNTGALESSIRVVKVGNSSYKILIDAPYAYFTEYGTRYIDIGTIEHPKAVVSMSGKQSYRPYLRVAVWRMLVQHADEIAKVWFR